MVRNLVDILTEINDAIKAGLSYGGTSQFFTLAHIQTQNDKSFPVANTGSGNGTQISHNDTYPLQIYHRIITADQFSDPERGKGNKPYRFKIYNMKMVGLGRTNKINNVARDINHEVAEDVSNLIPAYGENREYIEPGQIEVIRSKVWDEEFNGFDISKSSLEYIAFTIDYTIQQRTDC